MDFTEDEIKLLTEILLTVPLTGNYGQMVATVNTLSSILKKLKEGNNDRS